MADSRLLIGRYVDGIGVEGVGIGNGMVGNEKGREAKCKGKESKQHTVFVRCIQHGQCIKMERMGERKFAIVDGQHRIEALRICLENGYVREGRCISTLSLSSTAL